MNRKHSFIFSLLLGSTFACLSQSDIALAPCFGDGMVLQRSANTLLQGRGPVGKLLFIQFRVQGTSRLVRQWKVQVDRSGNWRTNINLTTPEFQTKGPVWTVAIEETKKHRREYQDVLIGDVILVAGWENQGCLGQQGMDTSTDRQNIRFLDLATTGRTGGVPTWKTWIRDSAALEAYSSLTLRLAHMLALGRLPDVSAQQRIGIVLVSRELLEAGLRTGIPLQANALRADSDVWRWIVNIDRARTDRASQLVLNKRRGKVANIPPVLEYDPAQWCSTEAFAPEKAPLSWFSFARAVWSVPQDSAAR
ncbi:MAG TPA: hypothetical protein P5205_05155 [Candidatus Paceibacterota bacterium]|nr:hypothetical protein [Verrucomicrobiota bacterium]HSA09742.1 hypothetical protein [Candidatus Paceibacterota bacterium]